MTKADYQRKVWTYKKRREAAKKKIRRMTVKIMIWQNEIRRIETKDEVLNRILKDVNRYFQVDIVEKSMKPEFNLARNIYYKIAIESKIQGTVVSEFIGRRKKQAAECRLNFSRSFKHNKKNIISYHNFKKYFETNSKA